MVEHLSLICILIQNLLTIWLNKRKPRRFFLMKNMIDFLNNLNLKKFMSEKCSYQGLNLIKLIQFNSLPSLIYKAASHIMTQTRKKMAKMKILTAFYLRKTFKTPWSSLISISHQMKIRMRVKQGSRQLKRSQSWDCSKL